MKVINNYQKYQEFMKENIQDKPKLLLHCCCAPCSSSVLKQLEKNFNITIYYYNPNTYPEDEYEKRFSQFAKLHYFPTIKETYNHQTFLDTIKGDENKKEGQERCFKCYYLRLLKTAIKAKEMGFDYFTTTLSISPHKNSKVLNEQGQALANLYGVNFLYSDFKKQDGYKESIVLSKQFDLYRQDYCGCEFSLREAKARNNI